MQRGFAGGADEAHLVHLAELLEEEVVEAVEVQEIHRLVYLLELICHHDLEHFVEGADAAGEGDEGVAAGDDVFLALGHAADADELGDGLREDNLLAEERGDDAHDVASLLERGATDDTHQAKIAASVDERVSFLSEAVAESLGFISDAAVARQSGAAEDCYVHQKTYNLTNSIVALLVLLEPHSETILRLVVLIFFIVNIPLSDV